jgi:hypothetical protein
MGGGVLVMMAINTIHEVIDLLNSGIISEQEARDLIGFKRPTPDEWRLAESLGLHPAELKERQQRDPLFGHDLTCMWVDGICKTHRVA